MTNKWTDNGRKGKILLSLTLTMKVSYVANLAEFRPVMKEKIRTDGRTTDARKMVLLTYTLTMRESDVASLAQFRPVIKEYIA